MDFKERVEELKKKIREDEFLHGTGLSGEVPFWIFDYPPQEELFIRNMTRKLDKKLNSEAIKTITIDLFDVCSDILEREVKLEKVEQLETKVGSKQLLTKCKKILRPEIIKNEIRNRVSDDKHQIIMLTGIGKAWPLIRAHSILNNLQAVDFQGGIVILYYPGSYSGSGLRLFNKLDEENYYRAFRLIDA